ncbi:MAG: flagellar protein FlaG [Clostridiaceae bacterium]
MKIEGTDAQQIIFTKANNGNTTVNQGANQTTSQAVNSVEKAADKSEDFNIRNLSRMSEFDRNDLPISDKVVIEAIERANEAISVANKKFEYSIHEKTNEIMVKVIDSNTNKVIREIPPEKILDMVAKMWEMAGILVDERR